jgi:Mrp family chromosome partitioning ATPase
MERIQRALELARLQRAVAGEAAHVALAAVADARPVVSPAAHEVQAASDAPSLKPTELRIERAPLAGRRVILPGEASAAAHAYRMLRSQVLQRVRAQKLSVIGVVSPADGEGKTLTAVNLALALAAEPNQSVILADLDLRHPSIAALLGLPAPKGLDAYLAGRAGREEILYSIQGIDRLSIVPALAALAGSSEALAGAPMRELLVELKRGAPNALFVLDLPPVLLSDDFLAVAPSIDAALLVACEGRTRREDLERARELLEATRLLGTVLNRSNESERRAY